MRRPKKRLSSSSKSRSAGDRLLRNRLKSLVNSRLTRNAERRTPNTMSSNNSVSSGSSVMRNYPWPRLLKKWKHVHAKKIFKDTSKSRSRLVIKRLKKNLKLNLLRLLVLRLSLTSKKRVSILMLSRLSRSGRTRARTSHL